MTKRTRSLALLLFAMVGPALWAAYLFVVYGAQTLACPPFMAPMGGTSLTIATLVSAAIVLCLLALAAWRSKRRDGNEQGARFTFAMSYELIALAAIGVAWIAIAAALIPLCAPAD
jgi:hypothetical protein